MGCNKESRHYLSELWSVVRVGVPAGVHQSPVLGHDLHWRPAGHRVGPCSLFNDLHHLMVEIHNVIHPLEILYEYQDSKIWFNVTFIRGKRHWQYDFFSTKLTTEIPLLTSYLLFWYIPERVLTNGQLPHTHPKGIHVGIYRVGWVHVVLQCPGVLYHLRSRPAERGRAPTELSLT